MTVVKPDWQECGEKPEDRAGAMREAYERIICGGEGLFNSQDQFIARAVEWLVGQSYLSIDRQPDGSWCIVGPRFIVSKDDFVDALIAAVNMCDNSERWNLELLAGHELNA